MREPNMMPRQGLREERIEGLLHLYEIKLSNGSVAHLFPSSKKQDTVTFNHKTYQSHPIETEGFSWSPNSPIRQPILRLSHLDLPDGFAPNFENVRGGQVTLTMTLIEAVNDRTSQDYNTSFPPETWFIDKLISADEAVIQLGLEPVANLQDAKLPKRVILRDICQHRYRIYDDKTKSFDYTNATCPYTSSTYFTADGTPTTNADQDSCSLHLETGCKKRYVTQLPFMGFPGLSR